MGKTILIIKEEKMKRLKKVLALCLSAAILLTSIPFGTAMGAAREPEIVAGGYEIDMADLPKVHFAEHPEWEELYDAAWESHKSNIRKARAVLNPEEPYYVDEAFSDMIFVWDTLLMMMFDKYGIHQFPTLQAMDNFYYWQVDNPGQPDDGFIAREISEITGENASYNGGYDDPLSVNPPLFAWAEWQQYQVHGDKSRFTKVIDGKTVLERIVSHFDFIKRTRLMDNGLYGKTTGLANGFDNTPNQDYGSKEQTYNDLSIQQAQSAYYIAKIAHEIGDTETEERFQKEYEDLTALINEKLWSEEGQFYFNLDKDQQFTNVPTPTGLWALSAHVATPERADAMVRNYALNSEKMFRPQGLSTVTYDWPSFYPTGKYWNGAVWAPSSFQYIKGLEYYGYRELAFGEALRHLEALSDVYQAGKTDSVIGSATFWENYSSEYTRQGDPARSNFVGWTGALAIGVIIEDILGIDLNAPENTVNWDLRLTEENGISNLYMCHDGQPVRVSLSMEERTGSESPADITVTATEPVTLHVLNGDVEVTLDVPAGTTNYHIDGVEDEAEPYLSAAAHPFQADDASLTKEALDANAADYVVFSTETDESIDDGLQYQAGKKAGLITNVNTVGFRADSSQSPVELSTSAEMEALGFSGAQSLTKGAYSLGEEGFMFTVPATNESKTVKLIVGVQNTTATLTAALSDASSPRVSRTLYGGEEESTYVVEIPYRAGGDEDRHLLVQYEAERASKGSGSVSIKGIILEDGGEPLPADVENVSLAAGNQTITVSADNTDAFDSYKIYVGEDRADLSDVRTADTLPYVIEGLDNYKRYYVAVSGVKDGVEGALSDVVSEVPEESPRSARERAYADYEAARDTILNGNTGFDALYRSLNFDVTGPIYGTTFTFTSTMNGQDTGLMDNGSVVCPTQPQPDQSGELTILATYEGETVKIVENVTVLSLAYDEKPYVSGMMTSAMGTTIDLTAEGTKDWAQFNADDVDVYARKDTENTISGLRRLVEGGVDHAVDMPLYYTATDAKDTQPTSQTCITSRGEEGKAGFEFNLPYSDKMQHANLYVSSWNATTRVEVLVNGSVMYTATYGGSDGWDVRKISLDYKLMDPSDELLVRQILVTSNTGGPGGSVGLPAVTLAETDGEIPEPSNDYAVGTTENASGTTVDLTAEGTTDWAQFPTKYADDYAKKNTETVITNFHRLVSDDTPYAVDVAKDMQLSFTASDAAEGTQPKNQWAITCRGPERQAGFAFNLPTAGTVQHVNIYAGSWSAICEVQLLIDGQVRYTTTYGNSSGWDVQKIGIDYWAEDPESTVEVRMVMNESLASIDVGGSIALGAVTLADTGEQPPEVDEPEVIDNDFNIRFTNTLPDSINLTEEGGKDWMLFNSVDGEAAYERKNVEPSIKDFTIFDTEKAPHRVNNSEYDTVYSFTDGTPTASMENQKPYLVVEDVDNGVSFTLPGGENRHEAKITIGNWHSDMVVEMTSGDKTASYAYEVLEPTEYGMFTLTYRSAEDVNVRIYNRSVTRERYGNFSITAIMLNEVYSIAAEEAEGGSVKLTRSSANAGETVDVFVEPDPNYHLVSLAYRTADGELVPIENNRFVMPNEDVTVVAEFARQSRMLTVGYSAGVDLVVTSDVEPIVDAAGIYAANIEAGTPVTFTFTPSREGSTFVGAYVNGEPVDFTSDSVTYTYTVPDENSNLSFTFDLVNKSVLAQTISIAEELVGGDEYANAVESVQKAVDRALENAKEVYDDTSSTQAEVNEAWSDLLDALHYLSFEKGDLTELGYLIDLAESIDTDEFTSETVEAFQAALDAAKDVYDDGNDALAVDVEKAWQDLYDAMLALSRTADKSSLNAVLTQANLVMEEIDKYVEGSGETLRNAIDAAQAVMDDASATQAEVDAAAEALAKVLADLRKIPSKEELLELLSELEQLDLTKYTASSAAAMQAQINLLRATVEDANATGEEYAAVYYSAKEAKENLVLADRNTSNNKGSGSTSANIGNAYGAAGVVSAAQGVTSQQAYVVSDTTVNFTLKRGSAYCFKMTVVNGNNLTPSFTVGNGDVLKTQFVAKVGNDYYYRVYAIGTPGQSTGVYTTLPGNAPVKHCAVTIG